MTSYDVILDGKWSLAAIAETITLEEALDDIAMQASVTLTVTPDFPGIAPSQSLQVIGQAGVLFDGVVWECDSTARGQKHLTVTAYDRTIYLARSEDEYLFPAGQTATQRLKRYAADWTIPLGSIADTGVPLARAVYRTQAIYNMIRSDLRETVQKGGGLFRARMSGRVLDLVPLGSNQTVWILESIEEINQKRTLNDAVTQVKVLGEATDDERSPVLAIAKGDTATYGTLQKIIQDSRITTAADAKKAAQAALTGIAETITVTAMDIETIRAGDKVQLNGVNYLILSTKHKLGPAGEMTLELASSDYVRRTVYA